MYVSIGQGGNQLAACYWQRAQQQRQQLTTTTRQADTTKQRSSISSSTTLPSIPVSPLFALDGYAHAIFLDAEPKVVGKLQELGEEIQQQTNGSKARTTKSGSTPNKLKDTSAASQQSINSPPPASSVFRPSNLFYEQYGRGNNFAMGYMGRMGDEGADGSLLAETMDAMRLEAERMEVFDSIVMMHSIAGGTGSGLGSRITEEIREQYPKQFILSCCIAPFGLGDTPLQHYNSLLCLSHLYPIVDGLILASNADMARALSSHAMKAVNTGGSPAMSFAGINTYLSGCLADILAPTKHVPTFKQLEQEEKKRMQLSTSTSSSSTSNVHITTAASSSASSGLLATPSLHELISHVTPLPAFKLMEIWSSGGLGSSAQAAASGIDPRTKPSWKSCLDTLKRFIPPDPEQPTYQPGTIGYSVYARGDTIDDPVQSSVDYLMTRFQRIFPSVSWNPYPLDLITTQLPRMNWRQIQPSSALQSLKQTQPSPSESTRSVAVCVNRIRTADTLVPVVNKARILLENKAYLHWVRYMAHGISGLRKGLCESVCLCCY